MENELQQAFNSAVAGTQDGTSRRKQLYASRFAAPARSKSVEYGSSINYGILGFRKKGSGGKEISPRPGIYTILLRRSRQDINVAREIGK